MKLFNKHIDQDMINNLLNVKEHQELSAKLTTLQNEINVSFDTKIMAVSSINDDKLAAAFAKALADTYNLNDSKCLIIDANLYNPCLQEMIGKNDDLEVQDGDLKDGGYKMTFLDKNTATICIDKQIYPGNAYKNKAIHNLINEHLDEYDHFIVLVPSIKHHKEVVLLGDIITSLVLITQRNVTKKKDIFEAAQYCYLNKLPLAKTVVLK